MASSTTRLDKPYPFGDAMRIRTPSMALACTSEVATLLPSPTKVKIRPARVPQCSRRVIMSASAWQGCSVSLSALMMRSRVVARAASTRRSCLNVRMIAAATHRSRFRATSATASRLPSASSTEGLTISPPNSRTAISNVARVRSEGLSNNNATCWPASRLAVGAPCPSARLRLSSVATSRQRSRSAVVRSRIERKSFFIVG